MKTVENDGKRWKAMKNNAMVIYAVLSGSNFCHCHHGGVSG